MRLALILLMAFSTPALSAGVKTQKPCAVNQLGYCVSFSDIGAIPVIRSHSFMMPQAGKALVAFNGTMECFDYAAGQANLKLAAQIVTSKGAVPDYRKPSGGRHTAVIDHFGNNTASAVSFNLGAQRTISYAGGGTKSVHFKIARLQHDSGWNCFVTAAAFTVTTFP